MPPTYNLRRRGVDEDSARVGLLDALSEVPHNAKLAVCGDFNARVGTRAPMVSDVQLPRVSADVQVCRRGKWLVDTCTEFGLHILNGAEPGVAAPHTCSTHKGQSVVDLVLCRDSSPRVRSDDVTLKKLSDHIP